MVDEKSAGPRGEHLLLAEDNPVNRKLAVLLLERIGYRVDVAANGLTCVEAVRRKSYDLILMDCQMPGMDGYQATAEIRNLEAQRGTHVPILALTANAMPGDREKCIAAGMDDHIAKPFTLRVLEKALGAWLRHS